MKSLWLGLVLMAGFATLCLPSAGEAQNPSCGVCWDGAYPFPPGHTVHRFTGDDDDYYCTLQGEATHDCDGDESGEYWDGPCGDHSTCFNRDLLDEIGQAESISGFRALSLALHNDQGVIYDPHLRVLVLTNCGGETIRVVRVNGWFQNVVTVSLGILRAASVLV